MFFAFIFSAHFWHSVRLMITRRLYPSIPLKLLTARLRGNAHFYITVSILYFASSTLTYIPRVLGFTSTWFWDTHSHTHTCGVSQIKDTPQAFTAPEATCKALGPLLQKWPTYCCSMVHSVINLHLPGVVAQVPFAVVIGIKGQVLLLLSRYSSPQPFSFLFSF